MHIFFEMLSAPSADQRTNIKQYLRLFGLIHLLSVIYFIIKSRTTEVKLLYLL